MRREWGKGFVGVCLDFMGWGEGLHCWSLWDVEYGVAEISQDSIGGLALGQATKNTTRLRYKDER